MLPLYRIKIDNDMEYHLYGKDEESAANALEQVYHVKKERIKEISLVS